MGTDPAAAESVPVWHGMTVEAVAERLQSDAAQGLTEEKARLRLQQYGPNRLLEGKRRGPVLMLLSQFGDFMILVLIAAAVISGLVGDPLDAIAILAIVLLNAVIGFAQEYRAERAMAALRRMAAPRATVRRGGHVHTLAASDLVPGDLVLLEAGSLVPADLRLVEVAALRIDEAVLTGESNPVDKSLTGLPTDTLLAERSNMAYKGTLVSHGRAFGLVVAIGMATELGRIASLLSGDETLTPLQKRLADFGRKLAWVVLGLCAILFATGVARGGDITLMFFTAVSLAVAAIPEALPAVVTISLALGARRMVRQRALIRRLPAVETLGSVTYICSDKTGTLTQNKMQVARTWRPVADAAAFYRALALSNDCSFDVQGTAQGDPTELALYRAALEQGQDKRILTGEFPRVAEAPFDATRKRMSTVHRADAGYWLLVKGAPETLLPLCRSLPADAGAALDEMAHAGLRVLAFAWRRMEALPATIDAGESERDLDFIGFAGLHDPPRPEARQAVMECRAAGIVPVMITGDHPATAAAIARELGILEPDGEIIAGPELARLDQAELERRVETIRVYARVDPEQKIRIVQALQKRGELVAMTGDGVNDAPALKAADIGVAMGKTGTDVAREAASLVLLDDNFATIVAAVRQGRRIYDNIRKFVRFNMTGNASAVLILFLAPFSGLPIPLLPIHILWFNMVIDGLPGLALAAEPAERGIMQRPPRQPKESIFARGLWLHIFWVGLLMGGVAIFTQAWAMMQGSAHWQTMVFTVLTLSQMGHVLAIRSERESFFRQGARSNWPLLYAVLLTFVLQMAVLYVPALNPIFKTVPLTAAELGFCLILSSVVFFGVELEKWGIRRGWLYRG